jgi:signal peptidase II
MTLFRTSLILLILTCCVGCDQMTKQFARERLPSTPTIGYFSDMVVFQYTENRGAAMSFGADFPRSVRLTLFVGMAALILFGILGLVLWQNSLSTPIVMGLSMIVGGGLGNLLDRIMNHGRVIDFMILRCGKYQTAIFNGADAAITAGVLIIIFSILLNSGFRRHLPS